MYEFKEFNFHIYVSLILIGKIIKFRGLAIASVVC